MERHKGVDAVLVEQPEHLHNQLLDLTGWIIPGAVHAARLQGLHLADGCHFAIQCRSSSSARLRADTGRPLGWIARSGHCGNGCCSHLVFRLARAVAYRYRVVQPRAAHERDRFSRGETGFCETDVLLGYIVKIAHRRWDQAFHRWQLVMWCFDNLRSATLRRRLLLLDGRVDRAHLEALSGWR